MNHSTFTWIGKAAPFENHTNFFTSGTVGVFTVSQKSLNGGATNCYWRGRGSTGDVIGSESELSDDSIDEEPTGNS